MDNILESPEIAAAIEDCEVINSQKGKYLSTDMYARLKLFYTPKYRSVRLEIGHRGTIPTHYIDYKLHEDGKVCKLYTPGL